LSESQIHESVQTHGGLASLTDVAADDIEAIVGYWFGGADLDFLGIDRARLGTPADAHARFAKMIRSGEADQTSTAFAIRLDGALVGYTALNRYATDRNFSHWHVIRPERRAAGLSSALYPYRLKMYFDLFPLERLTHQTRTRNLGVNRMLDKYVPVAETRHEEKPDGLAAPGEFHIRYVYRTDIPGFFRRAEELCAGE